MSSESAFALLVAIAECSRADPCAPAPRPQPKIHASPLSAPVPDHKGTPELRCLPYHYLWYGRPAAIPLCRQFPHGPDLRVDGFGLPPVGQVRGQRLAVLREPVHG